MLSSTYRVQLTPENGFSDLRDAVPYLHSLGITHLYLSPVFQSRAGSTHGYDVTDHSRLNEELGGRAGFDALCAACRERGMGIVLDIVPNHMALGPQNSWWSDVLENGPASEYAHFFDIDWAPARASMHNRLLAPVLSAPLGEVIDGGGIRIVFRPASGTFFVSHGDAEFPLEPRSYALLFRDAPPDASIGESARQEFTNLLDAFAALPPPAPAAEETLQQRNRDRQVNQRRLARLCARESAIAAFIERALRELNAPSPDRIARILQAQPYRLAFWRVSGDEVNYRRFFDVNELVALRVEEPAVFAASHALLRELRQSGVVDGIRVDHADGLYDPEGYFFRLRDLLEVDGARPWIVAEKILAAGEVMPDWCVDGTTGYEFGALVTAWLSRGPGIEALGRIYQRHVRNATRYGEIVYQSKKQVMRSTLAAEISMLAIRLDRLAQMHAHTGDFTLFDLREAIVETIACFPVYRTYITPERLHAEDAQQVRRAIGAAFSRKQSARRALEFLHRVLMGELASDPVRSQAAVQFTLRFQQVTGPVMAKGVEDTAFYRYASFLAMNEVGADPDGKAISTEMLHRANETRQREWPRTMLSTSTHDSKRGEDVRLRLCVLSEVPQLWAACLGRWRRLKRRRGADTAALVQEYLLLQSLLGIWPVQAAPSEELRTRLGEYAIKAAREAKEMTSWLDPDAEAEAALQEMVAQMLPGPDSGFVRYFREVIDRVACFGLLNALSAVVLKLTAPGIPDLYQGTELPSLVLVDPDNRRKVEQATHAVALAQLDESMAAGPLHELAARLLRHWQDGRIKLFVTAVLLRLRPSMPGVFAGDYVPLPTQGAHSAHLCAFARIAESGALISVVSRWTATMQEGALEAPVGGAWGDSTVIARGVPFGRYVDVLTGREHVVQPLAGEDCSLQAAALFEILPVAVLVRSGP